MDSTTTLIGFAMAALAGYFAIMNPIWQATLPS
jgi:hypothetical protein